MYSIILYHIGILTCKLSVLACAAGCPRDSGAGEIYAQAHQYLALRNGKEPIKQRVRSLKWLYKVISPGSGYPARATG